MINYNITPKCYELYLQNMDLIFAYSTLDQIDFDVSILNKEVGTAEELAMIYNGTGLRVDCVECSYWIDLSLFDYQKGSDPEFGECAGWSETGTCMVCGHVEDNCDGYP